MNNAKHYNDSKPWRKIKMQNNRNQSLFFIVFSLLLMTFSLSCSGDDSSGDDGVSSAEYYSGGEGTVFSQSSEAFANPMPHLSDESLERHLDGDFDFEVQFVTGGTDSPGLGPLFNNNSCEACHPRDGRGRAPRDDLQGGSMVSMFLRVGVGNDTTSGTIEVPGMGTQLQDKAIYGETPEATPGVTYTEQSGTYGDGTSYSLRVPTYSIEEIRPDILYLLLDAGYTTGDIEISPRVAPPVFGRGLLEAIPEETILSFADENDDDGDGISGKANRVYNVATGDYGILGRFGLKAGSPTVLHQSVGAYNGDMGISTEYYIPDEMNQPDLYDMDSVISYTDLNTWYNTNYSNDIDVDFPYLTSANYPLQDPAGDPEITREIAEDVDFYIRTLAVPARRNINDSTVRKGQKLFVQFNCSKCHITEMSTGNDSDITELNNQTIHPYTDLLLHDMGDALADNRGEFAANGNEWKTAALWGVGLTQTVHGHTELLHDGRARSFEEAILWHGGEAEAAKENFRTASEEDRDAIVAFLKSL